MGPSMFVLQIESERDVEMFVKFNSVFYREISICMCNVCTPQGIPLAAGAIKLQIGQTQRKKVRA